MIEIREMIDPDWPSIARIYQAGMDTNLATFQTVCPSYDEWDVGHVKSCRLVIIQDSEIAGWAALSAVSSRCVYAGVAEVSVYIDTARHGRGLGAQLLNRLIESSVDEGFWTLQSHIMKENLASFRLHEKCGFRLVGYREKIGRDRFNIWRDTVWMERRDKSLYV